VLADYDLVSGKTIGVDATTLEANAAMRSIVRKDTKQNYQAFLTDLPSQRHRDAHQRRSGQARQDPQKQGFNDDWENPNDPTPRSPR